ncbi:MAG: organic hydroperoxide resistance protein [Verrucomicrobia bacterium]|nr:organic hydroperoxide resistance protein [Verrucomicrobiota bacterium]
MALQPLYTAVATATSGRDGHTQTSDEIINLDLSVPKELGGAGKPGTSNPEQLFAAGYAACFAGAVAFAASQRKIKIGTPQVTSRVTIGKADDGGFGLAVELQAHIPDVDRSQAEELVQEAHQKVCPYSKATRNNVDVKLTVV